MGSLWWWAQLGFGCCLRPSPTVWGHMPCPGTSQVEPLCPLHIQLWPRSSQTQRDLWSQSDEEPECPRAVPTLHPCSPSPDTRNYKCGPGSEQQMQRGKGHHSGWQGPHGPRFHSATITPLDRLVAGPWLCVGPTFAISLSPLAPARQRAQAAALLTLRPPLADCTGQGAAWLLSHICGWQKAGHGGWPGPSVQLASRGRGKHWPGSSHGEVCPALAPGHRAVMGATEEEAVTTVTARGGQLLGWAKYGRRM